MFAARTNWALAPNALTRELDAHARTGRELFDLTASNPTECGFHYDPSTILKALLSLGAMHYSPDPKGILVAREAVARYYAKRGAQISPERLILTTSTSEAYSYVFRLLCDPEDDVLVPQPSYPLFDFLAGINDVRLRPYGLIYDHGWQIDLHSVEKAITPRTRGILLVHPNNPTGSYVKQNERDALSRLSANHNIALIVDEVFLDYAHDSGLRTQDSFATNSAVLTFTLSGLSKIAGLPQMKVAWLAVSGPDELATTALQRLEVIADTYLSMSAPIQHATSALLEQRHAIQVQLRERIALNLAELDRQLAAQKLCSRLEIEGGWYAMLRVPVTRTDEELSIALLREASVYVHPGHFFECASDGYLVLSLITRAEIFKEGVRRLLAFINV